MEQQKIYNIKKRVFPLFNIIYTLLKQIFETFLFTSYSNSANISSFDSLFIKVASIDNILSINFAFFCSSSAVAVLMVQSVPPAVVVVLNLL